MNLRPRLELKDRGTLHDRGVGESQSIPNWIPVAVCRGSPRGVGGEAEAAQK